MVIHLKYSAEASQAAQAVKNPPANAEDAENVGSISRLGRAHREGNGNLLQYSCLKHHKDRGAWWAAVHRVAESQARLSN